MNMYITDTSWLLLNMPEPNKYKRIHRLGEISEYRFINYQQHKLENKPQLSEIRNIFNRNNINIDNTNKDNNNKDINNKNISIDTYINDFKSTIDLTNTYSENYLLNYNNYYYVGNIINKFV